ncbi:uncharacterized protein [Malus domestica]|uniref:uncharacterized protein isoform X2 n=1 Tax=Malus domestica TaxID=3750 RepID=UPI0039752C51
MGLQRPSLLRSFRFALSIYFFFPTACIQTKRGKEKKEKKKSHGKRVKGKRFCYGLLGEKKMEYLGQARTAVIDGSKGEMGDLENNFMEKSMMPEPLLWNCTIDCYGRYEDLSTALSVKDQYAHFWCSSKCVYLQCVDPCTRSKRRKH